jgi:hypothetical protein
MWYTRYCRQTDRQTDKWWYINNHYRKNLSSSSIVWSKLRRKLWFTHILLDNVQVSECFLMSLVHCWYTSLSSYEQVTHQNVSKSADPELWWLDIGTLNCHGIRNHSQIAHRSQTAHQVDASFHLRTGLTDFTA